MIATRDSTRWGLPKGALGRNETAEQAARREVLEETGIRATICAPLDSIDYSFRAGDTVIQKRVDFFLMRRDSGRLRPQLTEVDAVEWVPLDDSIRRASYDSERRLLELSRDAWSRLTEDERAQFATPA